MASSWKCGCEWSSGSRKIPSVVRLPVVFAACIVEFETYFCDSAAHTHCHANMLDVLRRTYRRHLRCSSIICTLMMRHYWYQPLLEVERDAHTSVNILMWQTGICQFAASSADS